MSQKVKERLDALNLATTHEQRRELDRVIEEKTGRYCDDAVADLTDSELKEMLEEARKRTAKVKKDEQISYVA